MLRTAEFAGQIAKKERILGEEVIQDLSGTTVRNLGCPRQFRDSWQLCNCISRTMTQRGINKIPKCFSCPGDRRELSKKSGQSTHDSKQARTKPWPTQPTTSDNNLLIMEWIKTNETPKYFSNLSDCRGLHKEVKRWKVATKAIVN